MSSNPWDFSNSGVTFDNPVDTFDGGTGSGTGGGGGSGGSGGSGFGGAGIGGTTQPSAPAQGTGSQSDILGRLQQLMPNGWFTNGLAAIRDAVLSGAANMFAFAYSILAYVRLQTRIATATDGFLDLAATDFFGNNLPRFAGQSDPSYRARIQANLFLERDTRTAVINLLTQLTGRVPIVFEPARIADTGAYNTNTMGYNVAGRYGSLNYPYQAFVTAFRPLNTGAQNAAGYSTAAGAYNTPSYAFYDSPIVEGIQDSDIYAAIASVHVFGTILWTQISS